MANVIKQIVRGSGDSQSIKMIVKDSERGPQGEQGDPGVAATISVGDTSTLPAGSAATVQNTGSSSAAVLAFGIPKGDKGDDGVAASVAIGSTTTLPAGYPAMVQNSGTSSAAILDFSIPQGAQGVQGPRGQKGDTGATGSPGRDGRDGKDGKNGKDGAIHYTAGTGIQITDGNVINATGAAVATWGGIQGTLSDQTDLQNALNAKQNTLSAGSNISISGNTISATDTTYSAFTGATAQQAGSAGLVPAPATTDIDKYLNADGTWATPPGKTYTAGANINISAQNEISATDTTYSTFTGTDGSAAGSIGLVPAPATTDAGKYLSAEGIWNSLSIPTVNDATLTIQQNGVDVATFTANSSSNATANITSPVITMTTADPGEGATLTSNNYIAVYGNDPIILDYSTTEINTGATWVNGATIYKKTISIGALPNNTTKTVAHNITGLSLLIRLEGNFTNGTNSAPIPYSAPTTSKNVQAYIDATNITIGTGEDRSAYSGYVTLYYTKSS